MIVNHTHTYLTNVNCLVGLQVPQLTGLVTGRSEGLCTVGVPTAIQDGSSVRLLGLGHGLSVLYFIATNLEE